MDRQHIETLLNDVRDGRTPVSDALTRLRDLPFEDLGFAKVDHHRTLRTGMPEVIFGLGKSPQQTAAIFERLAASGVDVLATKVSEETFRAIQSIAPTAQHLELAKCVTLRQTTREARGKVVVDID